WNKTFSPYSTIIDLRAAIARRRRMDPLDPAVARTAAYLEHATSLHAQYRAGQIHVHVPAGLCDGARALDDLVSEQLPASHAALQAAARGLFFSLTGAFDASESIGPYLAVVDRDPAGQPYRFLDMGALIATQPFGENDPTVVRAILESLPYVTPRYAHSY